MTTPRPSQKRTSAPSEAFDGVRVSHVILLIHGIRTTADWAEMVAATLGTEPETVVIPLRYGYFDLFQFWPPGRTRKAPIERVLRELRSVRREYPGAKVSVLSHSFGTYIISEILRSDPDADLHRLLLCGSIVREDYRWDLVRHKLTELPVNDCGCLDVWPILAKSTSWGYGASGTFGFGTAAVRDRFHPFRHSDYFDREFVTRYWLPFFGAGQVGRGEWEQNRPPTRWWQAVLSGLPLQWLAVGMALLVVLFFSWRVFVPGDDLDLKRVDRAEERFSLGSANGILYSEIGKVLEIPLRVARLRTGDEPAESLQVRGRFLSESGEPLSDDEASDAFIPSQVLIDLGAMPVGVHEREARLEVGTQIAGTFALNLELWAGDTKLGTNLVSFVVDAFPFSELQSDSSIHPHFILRERSLTLGEGSLHDFEEFGFTLAEEANRSNMHLASVILKPIWLGMAGGRTFEIFKPAQDLGREPWGVSFFDPVPIGEGLYQLKEIDSKRLRLIQLEDNCRPERFTNRATVLIRDLLNSPSLPPAPLDQPPALYLDFTDYWNAIGYATLGEGEHLELSYECGANGIHCRFNVDWSDRRYVATQHHQEFDQATSDFPVFRKSEGDVFWKLTTDGHRLRAYSCKPPVIS